MKDFYWNYFASTGNVDAYLLYKEMEERENEAEAEQQEQADDWDHRLEN